MFELLSYQEVLKRTEGTRYLLLGNGFSIACNPIFRYPNLFEFARNHGLSEHVIGVFEYLGTNNFEGVMRLLEDGAFLARHYDLQPHNRSTSSMHDDLESVKNALVSALAHTHLARPGDVPDHRKERCVLFLNDYKSVFTTNYDLLLYWVAMYGKERLAMQDGFRADPDEPDAPYVIFHEHIGGSRGIYFLHGALHLYLEAGDVRKHCWERTDTPLIDAIRMGLVERKYPLFVAEGLADRKLEQIQRSGYLSYCRGKLERIESPLIIYGLSLGSSDAHIIETIADNPKLPTVYIGLYGDPESAMNRDTRAAAEMMKKRRSKMKGRRTKSLEVGYFDSLTASVWD